MIADYTATQDEFADMEGQEDVHTLETNYYYSKVNKFVMKFFGRTHFLIMK